MVLSKTLKTIFAGSCGLIVGITLFFPWQTAAEYAAGRAAVSASEKNIFISFRDIYTEGLLNREFIYRNITADMPAVSIKLSEARVDPQIVRSFMSFSKTGTLSFGSGEVTTVTRQKIKWTSGKADICSDKDTLYIKNMVLTGDISAKGFINITKDTGKISEANMTVSLPGDFDRALQMLSNMQLLPLTKISSGKWRISR